MSKFQIQWITLLAPEGMTSVSLDGETFEVEDGTVKVPNVVISHSAQKGKPETFVDHLVAQGYKVAPQQPKEDPKKDPKK